MMGRETEMSHRSRSQYTSDVPDTPPRGDEMHDDSFTRSASAAPNRVKWQLYFYTMVAAASELANGYDIGAFSFAILYFKDDPSINLGEGQIAVLVGMFNLVAALGCLIAGPFADWLGRKTALMIGNSVLLVGTLMFTAGHTFGVLFLSRFIMGLGAGIAFMGPELYSSEISPAHVRGLTATWGELFINLGILIGYLSGWSLQPNWRVMVGLGAIIPTVAVILQIFIPESPRWLMQKGKEEPARAALRSVGVYTTEEENEQVEEIKETLISERSHGDAPWHELFCPSGALMHAMVVGWGVAFFQQANGSEAVVYFTPTVLEHIGVPPGNTLYGVTAAVGFCKAVFVGISLVSMDRIGRRPLLLISAAGVTMALLLLGTAFSMTAVIPAVAGAGLCLFMASFSVGWGPLAGVLLAEVFPLRIRGTAVGIGWSINRVVSGLVALMFLPMAEAIGEGGSFFVFFVVGLSSLLFSYAVVPETKGASLEDINKIFEDRAAKKAGLSTREWEADKGETQA